nr:MULTISPECIES: hypothetical protein [unclassified Moorena]
MYRLETGTVVSKPHYQKGGKPKARTQPKHITYHVQANLSLNPEVIAIPIVSWDGIPWGNSKNLFNHNCNANL